MVSFQFNIALVWFFNKINLITVIFYFCIISFKNDFNRFAKNDFENAFPRLQSHAHLKNSKHAQFNCLEHYQKKQIASNRSSKMHENSEKNQSHKGKVRRNPKKINEKKVHPLEYFLRLDLKQSSSFFLMYERAA